MYSESPKFYRYVAPSVTCKDLTLTLVNGLGRALTEQETRTIDWLCDTDYETRGVLSDLIKELAQQQEKPLINSTPSRIHKSHK
ncbi:hypothetical protein [Bacillus sp. ISL-46]|uniref:hypothetical protein n=1 Tax=Bacillus sp. ISL-46 TaxID=2819129 RepID=UPI001BEBFF6D|nr:hypothetical protein [Bacillus sp. ISL-46]MBT2721426.1 hypothetical protein [Bacillus sp. ISL-46]